MVSGDEEQGGVFGGDVGPNRSMVSFNSDDNSEATAAAAGALAAKKAKKEKKRRYMGAAGVVLLTGIVVFIVSAVERRNYSSESQSRSVVLPEDGESGVNGEGGTSSGNNAGGGGSVSDGSGDGGGDEAESFIVTDKTEYESGEAIIVTFQYGESIGSFSDDWVGIYACDAKPFYHSKVWQWACGASNCTNAVNASAIVLDSLPSYNVFNTYHEWPIVPFAKEDGTVNRCFKPVLLRFDGPSVPPYEDILEGPHFNITETDNYPVRTDNAKR